MADPPGDRGTSLSPISVPSKESNNNRSRASQSRASRSVASHTRSKASSQSSDSGRVQQPKQQQQTPSQHRQQEELAGQPSPSSKGLRVTKEKVEKLLSRINRQFSSQRPSQQIQTWLVPPRPPDQAASSLGKELAAVFLQTLQYAEAGESESSNNNELEALRHSMVECLAQRGIHPSIPHAFFEELTSTERKETAKIQFYESSWENWLPDFILQCEQQILDDLPNAGSIAIEDSDATGLNETMAAAIRAYARVVATINTQRHANNELQSPFRGSRKQQSNTSINTSKDIPRHNEILTTTYRRLQSSAGRMILLREFSRSVKVLDQIPSHLSPLLAASTLTLWATPHAEKTLLLQEVWSQCWEVIYATDTFSQFWDVLFWMTEALHIFLLVLPSAGRISREERPAWKELAQTWLMMMTDMIAFVVHATTSEHAEPVSSERLLAEWLQIVMTKLLPILMTQGVGTYRLSLEPFLEQLNGLIVEMDDSLVQLNTMVVFRLATAALTTPLKEETRGIMTLFSYLLPSESAFARSLTSTVGSIFLQDEKCKNAAKHLLKTAQGMDQQLVGFSDRTKTNNVLQLLEEGEDGYEVLKFVASVDASVLENLSAVKQIETLLFGIAMMEVTATEELREPSQTFLKHLLQKYQHLGLFLMPSLISDINAVALERTPEELLAKLQFLADSVTGDPNCAQQAWSLLGVQMLEPSNPVELRVTVLRLLPRLCIANKRLYRRVMDTLGDHRNGKPVAGLAPDKLSPDSMHIQPAALEIRLAVAASIADLAKDDLIRDTSDCIGWIQEFLTEDYTDNRMKTLLVHYAILTLHYLVVAGELDFDLVLKVLKKKLCAVTNIDDVKHLPLAIQEALALLLGDGECNNDSTSEDNDDDTELPQISAQVVGSVQVLIDLGFFLENVRPDNETSIELIAKVRRNIYFSLQKYSVDAIGLDEDGIKAAIQWYEEGDSKTRPPTAASRYLALQKLCIGGLQLPQSTRKIVGDFDEILGGLNRKMLEFEEEALSSSLWATKGTRHNAGQQRRGESGKTSARESASLPSVSRLQTLHKKMPTTFSCISRLLVFEGKSLSKLLALTVDISFEERDPFVLVFLMQGWLCASGMLLGQAYDGSKLRGLGSALEEVRRGLHSGHSSDAMYLTLTCLALYTSIRAENENDFVEQVQVEIWNAFKANQFENPDIAKICLALTAVSALRCGSQERVTDVIAILEQSVKGYGGQISFGATYGLALITQAIAEMNNSESEDNLMLKSKIGLVVGFLVGELLACTGEARNRSDVLTTLVACLQSGVSTPGLVGSMAESVSQQFTIPPAKSDTAKYLFICLGICLPSLSGLNGDLLLSVLFLLERFQWGSGKGIALIPVLSEAKESGVLTEEELNTILVEYNRIFEQGLADGNEDLFYAVNGTSPKPLPHVIREFLSNSSQRFDDARFTSPLIGAIVATCSFPCLGFGAKTFTASPRLRHDIPRSAMEEVLEVVSETLDNHSDHTSAGFSKNAVMLLGLLASTKNQHNDTSTVGGARERLPNQPTSSKLRSLNLDFALLPSPRQGTLLHELMRLVQQAHKGESPSQVTDMMRFVKCLEALTLPGHFEKYFLQPLISEDNELTKEGCISLLSSQISGRRKAVFDGRDFTNMALQIMIMPLVSFNTLLGSGPAARRLTRCLEGVVKSVPSELVENGIVNLWGVCYSLSSDETELLVEYLDSMFVVLETLGKEGKQNNLSPRTKKFLEEFVSTRIFSDLRELSWGSNVDDAKAAKDERSILNGFVKCLTKLPLESLELFGVLSFQEESDGFSGEVFRALVILELVRRGCFDTSRTMRELSKVLGWISKKFVTPGAEMYTQTFRRVSCAVAAATTVLSTSQRRELFLSTLEQLLLCRASACMVGIDLISVLLASWCSDVATDGDLSMAYVCMHATDKLQGLSDAGLGQMFGFFRHDLPFNLGIYGKKEKISSICANQLWRLYNAWSRRQDHGADGELLILKKAFIVGSSGETKEEDYVLLTTSILLEADNTQTSQSLLE